MVINIIGNGYLRAVLGRWPQQVKRNPNHPAHDLATASFVAI